MATRRHWNNPAVTERLITAFDFPDTLAACGDGRVDRARMKQRRRIRRRVRRLQRQTKAA